MPFLYKIYGWFLSVDVPWESIFALILPFDQQQLFVYLPVNLTQIWVLFIGMCIINATDLLFACLVHLLSMEFDNLAQSISDIDWDNDDDEGEEEAFKELKLLVTIHQELCEIASKLHKIFSFLMLVNIFTSIFAICIVTFLAISGINNYFLVKFSVPLVGMFMQIFLHCFFGDRLIESSSKVANGVYNSGWYKANPKYRKMALIIMVRAQRKQKIQAWKFADINLKTYCWIITTAHSYYSFLSGVYHV
ncbi:hypothetical protein PVAND_014654 [Polypedilum vanderplanki]|uniref:Odorant receptor n=1 Tax=Polypedilum vanderplanki TaxID=319348 RepID=A0A9J6BAK6_POLVA|nr:hypothetical protein PVAND_014654 [Polypedilum vanderplanki]